MGAGEKKKLLYLRCTRISRCIFVFTCLVVPLWGFLEIGWRAIVRLYHSAVGLRNAEPGRRLVEKLLLCLAIFSSFPLLPFREWRMCLKKVPFSIATLRGRIGGKNMSGTVDVCFLAFYCVELILKGFCYERSLLCGPCHVPWWNSSCHCTDSA